MKEYYSYKDVVSKLSTTTGDVYNKENSNLLYEYKSPELCKKNSRYHELSNLNKCLRNNEINKNAYAFKLRKKLMKIFDPTIIDIKREEVGDRIFDIYKFKSGKNITIDLEGMVHSYPELESMIIRYIMAKLSNIEAQVFLITHNLNILNLSIPNFNFVIFKYNHKDCIIEAIDPNRKIKHDERTLYNYIVNDYFSTSPNTEELENLIVEEYNKNKQ